MKLKVIKDTIIKSILSEITDKLEKRITDQKKRAELIKFTHSRLDDVLNSFSEEELLPKKEIESEQDFENHILKVTEKTRQQLLKEMEQEF